MLKGNDDEGISVKHLSMSVHVLRWSLSFRLADLMEEHQEELATIETMDSGAVYTLALKTHVGMSIQTFRYFAGWCDKIQVSLRTHTHTHTLPPSNTIMTMTSILTCAGEDDPHQPGPAQPESHLHQEGASGVSVGRYGPSAQKRGCVCWSCGISEDLLLLLQCVRHRHPVELPLDDAGLEERCLSCCWKHPGP